MIEAWIALFIDRKSENGILTCVVDAYHIVNGSILGAAIGHLSIGQIR